MRWACMFSDGSMNVHSGDDETQRRRAYEERDLWNKGKGMTAAEQAKVVVVHVEIIQEVQ